VPEAASIRLDPGASRCERRLRALARALTAATVAACLAGALMAPSALRVTAALAAAGALAIAVRPPRASLPPRLSVDRDGVVQLAGAAADEAAAVVYCGAGLVCLRTQAGRLPIWPDSLSADSWRRLLVACRWPRRTDGAATRTARRSRTK